MAAAADALQPARDRRRRLDLDDEIDRAHVDAELERRGGDERAQRAGLQQVFDLDALRAGDRSVMRPHERFAGQLVERAGQPLRQAPAVDEDQRRAMGANQLEQPRVDGRPDRRPRVADRRGAARQVVGRGRQPRHVLDRHFDRQLQRLLRAGVDDGDRAVADFALMVANSSAMPVSASVDFRRCAGARSTPPRNRATSSSGRCVADSPIRCSGRVAERGQPLDRQREMGAALGRHQRVNLVDDDRVDGAERLARVRREEQIQRFGRRDEDVGRLALKSGPFALRRVAGPDGDRRA